jgi:hypothetical protein
MASIASLRLSNKHFFSPFSRACRYLRYLSIEFPPIGGMQDGKHGGGIGLSKAVFGRSAIPVPKPQFAHNIRLATQTNLRMFFIEWLLQVSGESFFDTAVSPTK